jgi:hypothetical protein
MNERRDVLLDVLGHVNSVMHWYHRRIDTFTAADALADALEDWIVEQDEQPNRVKISPVHGDRLLDALVSFHHTVGHLAANGPRLELTVATALTEALSTWTAAASVEHNRSQPFPAERPGRAVAAHALKE